VFGFFDKRILNFLVIIFLSLATIYWTFLIFHIEFDFVVASTIIALRMVSSRFIYRDYSLSWSKSTQKTFLIKSIVYFAPLIIYVPLFYTVVPISFMLSELFLYLFSINFFMYLYTYLVNHKHIRKTKNVVIYGAGKAGIRLEQEFLNTEYKVLYFVDDDKILQKRSIDGVKILSSEKLKAKITDKIDLLVIAIPSAEQKSIKKLYEDMKDYFADIRILPPIQDILQDKPFTNQLKDISLEDLLARNPKDLDKKRISQFIKDKVVLITGAGGSIGSEISRQCVKYGAKRLILVDHSEYNLYAISEELSGTDVVSVMQSVVNKEILDKTFKKYKPQIVLHAAAYKHVPLVEENIQEGLVNNIIGTKNTIDVAIANGVDRFVLISTDKAVRPTNVMGATKRVCELYAQNVKSKDTEIIAVRFGNVLGSSGSVIPKFKSQIEKGEAITVTHPDITRYFMLIPEACELVLQASTIGRGGEIFILDMGEPVKIVDLAKRMIELSGKDVEIQFTGLRKGEKLYEELLINDSDKKTEYEEITVASSTEYNIDKLNQDIDKLINQDNKIELLKNIVQEFEHKLN
jgi:FlaA1/EpsC-like NDP-sugar epimerase